MNRSSARERPETSGRRAWLVSGATRAVCRTALPAAAAAFLHACSTAMPPPQPPAARQSAMPAAERPATPAKPAVRQPTAAPPAAVARTARQRLEQSIIPEIELREIPLPEAVRLLAELAARHSRDSAPANIILSPALLAAPAPRVTLYLRNVTAWDALRSIADAAGLTLRVDSNAVVIMPKP